jgi:hypothetical protein
MNAGEPVISDTAQDDQRMKLPGRGGHICRTNSGLSVAATPRSLSAPR